MNGLVKKEIQKSVLSVETEERGMIRVLMSYKKKVIVGLHYIGFLRSLDGTVCGLSYCVG